MQQAKLLKTPQRVDDGAAAHAGLGGDCVERRVETAGRVIEEVEEQRVQHREAGAPDHPAVLPRQVGLAVEAAGLLPASFFFNFFPTSAAVPRSAATSGVDIHRAILEQPQRIACGAPDYIVTQRGIPLGYIEAKDVGADLDRPRLGPTAAMRAPSIKTSP
jgi:hypothetical protein